MMIDDETLGAFIDGALDCGEHERVEDCVAREPALAARVAALRALGERIDADFAAIVIRPPPGSLAAPVATRRSMLNSWAPMALAAGFAGLTLGVFGAQWMRDGLLLFPADGEMRAGGMLSAALDGTPSGQTSGQVDLLYSVRAADGSVCRAFRVSSRAAAQEGAACRSGAGWRVVVLAASTSQGSGYVAAGADDTNSVEAAIDALDAGAPLSRIEEQRLIDGRWPPLVE